MQLRIAGHSQDAVAERMGITQQRVSAIEIEWLASRQPSTEVTEQRRQMQLAGIDSVRSRLIASLELEDELGARLAVVDRIAKLWDREAKLVGLDLQAGLSLSVNVGAEQLAALLGYDPPQEAIEGTAVEITDGS